MSIDETAPVTFYWPSVSCLMDDETVAMRATGWEEDGSRWTGERRWAPDVPDYAFWRWIFQHKDRWEKTGFFSDRELITLRTEYESAAI